MAETLIPADPLKADKTHWRRTFLGWIEETPARAKAFAWWRETLQASLERDCRG